MNLIIYSILFLFGFLIFGLIDTIFYGKAKYPERTTSWLYKLPCGGIYAYLKFGKHKGE